MEESHSSRDLSEMIKDATKEIHVRAENTELMLRYQRGNITSTQYKLLLCSLYEIYVALEEELERNREQVWVEPVFFPRELARREALERDLLHFFGREWRTRITVPAATHRYCQRLREVGGARPWLLVAHAYTRYLGDLSGGQVLGKVTQRSLGLSGAEGVAFFSFPGVTSPHRFKQLYRARMNDIPLSHAHRQEVLDEAVAAFQLNIEVFDDLQKMLSITEETHGSSGVAEQSRGVSALLGVSLGVGLGLATVGVGLYAL